MQRCLAPTAPPETEAYKMNGRLVLNWIMNKLRLWGGGFDVGVCRGESGLSGSQEWADEGLVESSSREGSPSLPAQPAQQTDRKGFLLPGREVFQMEMQLTFCCPSFCSLSQPPPTHCLCVSFSTVLISVILILSRDSIFTPEERFYCSNCAFRPNMQCDGADENTAVWNQS